MSTPTAVHTNPSTSPTIELVFPVIGMTCASRVRRIEKALNRVASVQDATVNLAIEKAKVVFDPGQVSIDQMRAAVEKAGYTVAEMPQTTPAVVRTPAKCHDATAGDARRRDR